MWRVAGGGGPGGEETIKEWAGERGPCPDRGRVERKGWVSEGSG